MSELPSPKEFKNYTAVFTAPKSSGGDTPSYDLKQMDKTFKEALKKWDAANIHKLGNELISWRFWNSCQNKESSFKYFGYSKRDDSVTVHLYDEAGEIQTVAIRNANGTKWKTYGSKKFTPYNIRDEVVFVTSGMAEIIICELLGISYIGLQSDSMVHHIPQHLKEALRGRYVVLLADNDSSFKKIIPQIKSFFEYSQTIVIDFEKLLKKKLPKGYDFRDFINQIGDAKKVLSILEFEIMQRGDYV